MWRNPIDMPSTQAFRSGAQIDRLLPPTDKPVRAVIDTDTYNEVDDQFALAYGLSSPESLTVEALYAAPYYNQRSTGPEDGMEKSYEEILRVVDRMGPSYQRPAFKGSRSYLSGAGAAVESPAARDLIERGMATGGETLYVLTIGAPTNVASALLMEPRLADHIVVVWLGGQPHNWPSAEEFNLRQDVHASRVLLDSGVPLVQIPCKNVAEHLRVTIPELEAHMRGNGAVCDYLCDIVSSYHGDHFAWSKVIWDISSVAWIVNESWVPTWLIHSPILTDGLTWSIDQSRHFIREAFDVKRDQVFADLFRKLSAI